MIVVLVDTDKAEMEHMKKVIGSIDPLANVHSFFKTALADAFIKENGCDVVIFDPKVFKGQTWEFANGILNNKPEINLIIASDSDDYMKLGYKLYVSDYLLKPVSKESVIKAFHNLRHPASPPARSRVQITCFGNFEIYIDGVPQQFKYNKAKELLAYLVDRKGAVCTNAEICTVLWDDENHDSYFKSIRKDLVHTLREKGCDNILVQQWGRLGINPAFIECDYYIWLLHPVYGSAYCGEYMSQYSWAEYTNGQLSEQVIKHGLE